MNGLPTAMMIELAVDTVPRDECRPIAEVA